MLTLTKEAIYLKIQNGTHTISHAGWACADPGEEGGGGGSAPLKNHKNIGFLSNTGPDPLKNYKATKPAFNVGPSSAFKWRFAGGPMMVRF